jgi:hypothetical protein
MWGTGTRIKYNCATDNVQGIKRYWPVVITHTTILRNYTVAKHPCYMGNTRYYVLVGSALNIRHHERVKHKIFLCHCEGVLFGMWTSELAAWCVACVVRCGLVTIGNVWHQKLNCMKKDPCKPHACSIQKCLKGEYIATSSGSAIFILTLNFKEVDYVCKEENW